MSEPTWFVFYCSFGCFNVSNDFHFQMRIYRKSLPGQSTVAGQSVKTDKPKLIDTQGRPGKSLLAFSKEVKVDKVLTARLLVGH